jgi:hypothetical protein
VPESLCRACSVKFAGSFRKLVPVLQSGSFVKAQPTFVRLRAVFSCVASLCQERQLPRAFHHSGSREFQQSNSSVTVGWLRLVKPSFVRQRAALCRWKENKEKVGRLKCLP